MARDLLDALAMAALENVLEGSGSDPDEVRRWSIVLAGGDGVRLRPYVEHRFGEPRPKQYCNFSGRRSMLQHTLARAATLSGAERTVTVVASAHERWSGPQLAGSGATVVTQHINRETGPGVYLPLCWVRARDPGAIVYILPSDHYVRPAGRFCEALSAIGELAAARRDRIVLTGVVPEGPDPEYGYIEPGDVVEGPFHRVARFVEKPGVDAATAAIARGAVWNTMVIAASVDALWEAGRACIPEVIARFDELVDAIDTPFERSILDAIYLGMPTANFSKDVLERIPERCLVARLDGVEWSDWGQAERIEATIAREDRRRPPLHAPAKRASAQHAG